MDFCIITPTQVERYDQTGILQRDVNVLDADKIKSVKINKKGLLYSLYNNGDIIFMSEGDTQQGEIRLNYINKPEKAKKAILTVLKRNFSIADSNG